MLSEIETFEDSIHDGLISQQRLSEIEVAEASIHDVSIFEQLPPVTEAAVEPVQEEMLTTQNDKPNGRTQLNINIMYLYIFIMASNYYVQFISSAIITPTSNTTISTKYQSTTILK
jgi:hypothetical protein